MNGVLAVVVGIESGGVQGEDREDGVPGVGPGSAAAMPMSGRRKVKVFILCRWVANRAEGLVREKS
jgi:hypothetical protein